MARELHTNPHGRAPSLRKVAAALAERGFVTPSGRPYFGISGGFYANDGPLAWVCLGTGQRSL